MADPSYTAPNSSTTSTLSQWAGPYVTDMLGQTQALASSPQPIYDGQLTAGASDLQNQAFQGIGSLTLPDSTTNFQPMTFSSGLPGTSASSPYAVGDVNSYMNPYISSVLNPQIDDLNRQSKINEINNNAKLTAQGAYGGSRQAILQAENQRNLLRDVGNVSGQAYKDAYDRAQSQQNAAAQMGLQAQQGTSQSQQFGAGLGLQAGQFGLQQAAQQAALGATQRDIEQQGLTADYNQFLEQRDWPYKQLLFEKSMLQGLPISTVTNNVAPQTGIQSVVGGIADLTSVLKSLGLVS